MLDNRHNYEFHDKGDYSYYSIGTDPLYIIVKAGYDGWSPARYYYGYDIFYVEVEYSPEKIRKYFYSGYRLFRVETEDGRVIEYGAPDWSKYDEEGKKLAEERSKLCRAINGIEDPVETQAPAAESKPQNNETKVEEPENFDELLNNAGLARDSKEAALLADIYNMNRASYEEASIDFSQRSYSPEARDYGAIWDKTVFYVLEGYEKATGYSDKNACSLEKKQLRNAENGNLIQYEIYINPETGIANKIVSIEYINDGLEVTEYYYSNQKRVSFIFRYRTDNYISTYATADKSGERYMFENDCMVTWRIVSDDLTANYVIGENEAGQIKNFPADTIHVYGSLSGEDKKAFDEKEIAMLNAAYITYELALSSKGIASIQGYVYDGTGAALVNAEVLLYTADFAHVLYTIKTDRSGRYFIYVPNEAYEYNIRIRLEGFTECEICKIHIYSGQLSVYQEGAYLFPKASNTAIQTSLFLGDAFNYAAGGSGMMVLSNAKIHVRGGIGNRDGEVILEAVSDANGMVVLSLLPGVYTIDAVLEGYEVMYYTIVVNPFVLDNHYEFYAAPKLNDGEVAVVLTWGAYPFDLDSHLFSTVLGKESEHIWFGHMSDSLNSYLDVDDTSSYGPETVTIRSFNSDKYYKYCVVDFTNCSIGNFASFDMSYSGACVNVYNSDGLAASYYVPANCSGVIWEVFEIRNGSISPIQRYYNNVSDKTWWASEK